MINKLRTRNDALIQKYEDDLENLNKQLIIKELLKNDECFHIIPMETAYSLILDLEYPEDKINEIYLKLI